MIESEYSSVIKLQGTPDLRDRAALAGYRQKQFEREADSLWADLAAGFLTLAMWQRAMKELLRRYHTLMALIAVGGDPTMLGPQSLAAVQNTISAQLAYLEGFTRAVAQFYRDRRELPRTGATRAKMYGGAGRATFWRNVAPFAAMLPAYPGDGTSECLVNCKCWWQIEMGKEIGQWLCYWNISEAEHCPTCLQRNEEWFPYIVYSQRPPLVFEMAEHIAWEATVYEC